VNAGLFSLPTGEMVLIRDSGNSRKQLIDLAVEPNGRHLFAMYFDDRARKILLTYDLPSLNQPKSLVLPPTAHGMRFDGEGLSFVATAGSEESLVLLDGQQGRARNIVASPGREILSVSKLVDGEVLIARTESREDLWLHAKAGARRLTSDGISVFGALSADGALISQKRLPGGRLAIFLRAPDGTESQVTPGPTDVTPAFYANGARWVYADIATKQLLTCEISSRKCSPAYADDLGPGFPSVDPAGHRVAFLTFNSPSRLRIASLDDGTLQRDLGPAAGVCSPVWGTDDHLWFVQNITPTEMTWSEISVQDGATTGRVEKVHVKNQSDCRLPGALRSSGDRQRSVGLDPVVSLTEEASDFLVSSRSTN